MGLKLESEQEVQARRWEGQGEVTSATRAIVKPQQAAQDSSWRSHGNSLPLPLPQLVSGLILHPPSMPLY